MSPSSVNDMPSSKTTILGIRLDHDRRAWIEAEAARQGLSIRGYFERIIDEARSAEDDPEEPAEPIARESVLSFERMIDRARSTGQDPEGPTEPITRESVLSFERMIDQARSAGEDPEEPIAQDSVPGVGFESHEDAVADAMREPQTTGAADRMQIPRRDASTVSSTAPPGFCDELISVAAIPGRVFREALELPRALLGVARCPFRRRRSR